MPWKVKKVRRLGPFWVSSTSGSRSQRIRSVRARTPEQVPMFGVPATPPETVPGAAAPFVAPQLFGSDSPHRQDDERSDLRDRRARLAHQATRELQEARGLV